MDTLIPHIHLSRIKESPDFNLSVSFKVDDDLQVDDPMPTPAYHEDITEGPYKGSRETVITYICKHISPPVKKEPFEATVRLNNASMGGDIRVTVNAVHVPPHHNHDGTSSAHYGDPKP